MASAVRHAMQQCCLQLKCKISKRLAAREQRERKRNLSKYIPNAAAAFMQILEVRPSLCRVASVNASGVWAIHWVGDSCLFAGDGRDASWAEA
jgi:DNA topoisomerase VI subunit B